MARTRTLTDLLRAADIHPLSAPGADPEVHGVCLDSRRVAKGELFLALPGARRNGDEFVPEALSRGACAVLSGSPRPDWLPRETAWVQVGHPRSAAGLLAREVFGRPDESLCLVGITGTNGKTTTSYLVESIARAAGRTPGRIGTVGYACGGRERAAPHTTPEAPDLYRMLAEMRAEGADVVVMEVSSHALALGRVEGARFRIAALVSFGRDHLDFHGSLDAYFDAKALLFERLDPAHGIAVVPADDPAGAALARRTPARVLTFGRSKDASVRLRDERCDLGGCSAVLDTARGELPLRTSLIGRFNLDNIAAAAACALAAGFPSEAIPAGVAALASVPGRVERVDQGQPFAVLVDYAHTPDALARLLASVREVVAGRLLLVFGCGGDRDRGKRPEMGRVAAEGADLAFLTSDNPRDEDPAAILRQIEAGIRAVPGGLERRQVIADRTEAVRAALEAARPGDAVLVAGKGHEATQTIGDRILPLDDREIVREALSGAGFAGRGTHAEA